MTLLEPNPARARPGLSDRGRASWAGTVWLESGSTSTMSDLIRSDPTSTTSDLTRSMKSDPIRLEQMLIISDQNGSDLIATMSDSIGSNTDTDDVRSHLIGSDIANIGSDPMLTPMMSDSIRSDPTLMMPTRIPCVRASTRQLEVGTVASSTDSSISSPALPPAAEGAARRADGEDVEGPVDLHRSKHFAAPRDRIPSTSRARRAATPVDRLDERSPRRTRSRERSAAAVCPRPSPAEIAAAPADNGAAVLPWGAALPPPDRGCGPPGGGRLRSRPGLPPM